jgi:hypothetical protein
MKITKGEYLKALETIKEYKCQFENEKYKPFDEVYVGDYVECVHKYDMNSKNLILNKQYFVHDVWISPLSGRTRIRIRTENGRRKNINFDTIYFKALRDKKL